MLYNYFLALLVLAVGYYVCEGTNNKKSLTFTERVTNLLERKCLKNLDEDEHKKMLEQLDHLKNDCFNLAIGPEGITDEKLANLCHEQADNFVQCLTTFAEKVDPCLHREEKFLKQLIVDIYNTSSAFFCDHIEVLNAQQLLKTNTVKCLTTLKKHPEINPHLVCFENSTTIGDIPSEDIITKEKFCSSIMQTNVCYHDLLDKHCSDAPEVQRIQKGIVVAVIDNCMDVLFRGTTVTYPYEGSTKPTEAK